jgi:hypothetical protein
MAACRPLIAALVLLLAAGCFSTFTLNDSGYRPRGRSLAVVAGLDNEASASVARGMTEAFRKHTRFQVLSQGQVAQAVPGYPQKIKGPYTSAYFQIEADYGNTDRRKVRELQHRIGADYLYVVWAPTATVTQGTIHQLHIIAQLFEGPDAKEVGGGMFNATAGRVGGCCLVPAPTDRDRGDAVKDSADYVVREIGEKLGMLK